MVFKKGYIPHNKGKKNLICPKCNFNEKMEGQSYCKKCKQIWRKEFYNKNIKFYKKENLEYYNNHKETLKEKHKFWVNSPRGQERIKIATKKYQNKPDVKLRILEYSRKPERKQKQREYHQGEEFKTLQRNNYNNRFKSEPEFVIRKRLRSLLYQALKNYTKTGKIMKSKEYGLNYNAIIDSLKPFPVNLSNYDLHHKKALFYFNFINEDGSQNLEEIRKAFSPDNLVWLPSQINRSIQHKIKVEV